MKKIITILFVGIMVLSLVACGEKATFNEEAPVPADNVGIANPWSEVETPNEAAQSAGVEQLIVPENGTETSSGRVDFSSFHYMEGIAEANGYIGTADFVVRKGLKQEGENISGDYTEYVYSWTQDVDGILVSCSGNEEGKTMNAIWDTDNYSYSMIVRGQGDISDTYGIDADAVSALVTAIK